MSFAGIVSILGHERRQCQKMPQPLLEDCEKPNREVNIEGSIKVVDVISVMDDNWEPAQLSREQRADSELRQLMDRNKSK